MFIAMAVLRDSKLVSWEMNSAETSIMLMQSIINLIVSRRG